MKHSGAARDARGRWITLVQPPQRIVSLVPSLTELVCALGDARRLVGVTRYCIEPAAIVRTKTRVGGTKNPRCDTIVTLRPDLVIANIEENRAEDVAALEQAGLRVFVTYPRRVRDAETMIRNIGRLLGRCARADTMERRIATTRAALKARRRHRVAVFCPIWRNPWMGFNRDTYAHDMLSQAGGMNVLAGAGDRYPHTTLADIAALAPEIILLPDEPYRFAPKHLRELEPLRDTPAYRNQRIHFVDGKALSWYGPRTASALRYFGRLLAIRHSGERRNPGG